MRCVRRLPSKNDSFSRIIYVCFRLSPAYRGETKFSGQLNDFHISDGIRAKVSRKPSEKREIAREGHAHNERESVSEREKEIKREGREEEKKNERGE